MENGVCHDRVMRLISASSAGDVVWGACPAKEIIELPELFSRSSDIDVSVPRYSRNHTPGSPEL